MGKGGSFSSVKAAPGTKPTIYWRLACKILYGNRSQAFELVKNETQYNSLKYIVLGRGTMQNLEVKCHRHLADV